MKKNKENPELTQEALLNMLEDLEAEKKKEEESEKRYKILFENMIHGLAYCKMIFDKKNRPLDFIYLNVNKSFDRLTGLKNVIGKKKTEKIPATRETKHNFFKE